MLLFLDCLQLELSKLGNRLSLSGTFLGVGSNAVGEIASFDDGRSADLEGVAEGDGGNLLGLQVGQACETKVRSSGEDLGGGGHGRRGAGTKKGKRRLSDLFMEPLSM